ncbi:STAS domain-containing protein [Glycomyces sp. A-F 0318]|uniref:STAS domain-containing protein n=1 Tax=Glycomyces amatae TaxID=2881355 RepID=UPI001E5F127E|nr:STAS domain-containing protein [Glycomyces amatae]MCD0444652.1 STAS domain-containing protein [Glycomyces amatae]
MAAIEDDGARETDAPSEPLEPGPPEGPLRATETTGPLPVLHVSGSVDLNSHDDWGRVLRQATVRHGELHVDLAGLAFIDMRGVSVLVDVARGLPEGARVVVHRAPPCMRRMMEVLWPAGLDAITIKGDAR